GNSDAGGQEKGRPQTRAEGCEKSRAQTNQEAPTLDGDAPAAPPQQSSRNRARFLLLFRFHAASR
ncbi:MAG: hypothetical protein ACRENQ_14665, partial [Gemmatimonadaceae bacterium]